MKNKLIIVMLLLVLFIPNFVFAENIINTNWVYDKNNSISEDTINYIYELNENELKEYQYAVYITDTLNGENMNTFKTNLFNKYGIGSSEKNSGILFVLATVDREYGLEFGDGISAKLERELRKDFIPNIALNELKSGDWDNAVYKISNHVLDLVIDSETVNSSRFIGEGNPAINNAMTAKTLNSFLMFMLLTVTSIPLIMVFTATIFSDDRVFFRGEEFNNYVDKYSLDKEKVLEDFKINSNSYSLGQEGLYNHLLNTMVDSLSKRHLIIDIHSLKKVFSLKDFKSQKSITVDILSKELYDKHKRIVKIEKEIKDRNNKWIDEIVGLNIESYSDGIVSQIRKSISSYNCDKNTFIEKFHTQYRMFEIDDKLRELFPELSNRELREISNNLKKTQEYKDYINGIRDTFIPSHERIEKSPYYARENIGDISGKSSRNIWFWLWIYGMNSNRISRDKQRKEAARRSQARRNSTSSHNSKPFGSSFGGGFSSGGHGGKGGGFSGKF